MKLSDVSGGKWPSAPVVDRLAAQMGVMGRTRQRDRDTVKADIVKAWREGVSEIVLEAQPHEGE